MEAKISANPAGPLPIRVLIVDDHPMMAQALVRNFESQPDFEVVGGASTVAAALDVLTVHAVDVVVLDYHLPDGDGATATRQIVDRWAFVKVVMLTGSGDEAAVFEAARAGCSGFMDKTGDPADLVRIVRNVSRGAIEFPPVHLDRLPQIDQLLVHYQPIVDLSLIHI